MAKVTLDTDTGWYEFIKRPEATTHIMHKGENTNYFPEAHVTLADFLAAVDRGQAYQLVRVVDVEAAVKDYS